MKFTRLSENDIRCVISEGELVDYGINLDDIIEKKGRTREFFRQLLDMAAEKLGMKKTDGLQLASAQISVLKDNSISIVFHESNVEEALSRITGGDRKKIDKLRKDIQEQIRKDPDKLSKGIRQEIIDVMEEQLKAEGNYSPEVMAEISQIRSQIDDESDAGINDKKHESAVLAFGCLDDAISFCRVTCCRSEVVSSLFRSRKDGLFYLFILKGEMELTEFSRLLFAASEYGRAREYSNAEKAYLLSVSDIIIEEDAYSRLRSIGTAV